MNYMYKQIRFGRVINSVTRLVNPESTKKTHDKIFVCKIKKKVCSKLRHIYSKPGHIENSKTRGQME